jgi:HlyD family secretion protein
VPRFTSRFARHAVLGVVAVAALAVAAGLALRRRAGADAGSATVGRGDLVVTLTEPGRLAPAESITYRSPVEGRELEIAALAPEGVRVDTGDLVVRLDPSQLQADLERATEAMRQARLDRQVAEAEWEDAKDAVASLADGEGALGIEEAESEQRLAERKAARLSTEYQGLKPLLDQGYITRDELDRLAFELEQAEAAARLAKRKAEVLTARTRPRNQQKAAVQVTARDAQREAAGQRVADAEKRVKTLEAAIQGCSLYARHPGLVVYEDYLPANPRRKIRTGDRVTPSHGLVTIPALDRMVVETSVREKDVYRVRPGLDAAVTLDAFPSLRFAGRVKALGTLARTSVDRPFDEKRFDVTIEVQDSRPDWRPDMTARVDLIVVRRTNVVVVPVAGLFERDGAMAVSVLHAWGAETRAVTVGESNDERAEVVAGLGEGETIALPNAPPVTLGPGRDASPAASSRSGAARRRPESRP